MRTEVVLRKYGALPPRELDETLFEHARKMQRLYNRCVEIERDHRQRYFDLVGEDATVAELQGRIDALQQEQAEVKANKKRMRAATRSKRQDDPEVDQRLRELRGEIKELIADAKAARASARTALKPKLDAIELERREAIKTARQEAAADGLWWPNYNAVLERFDRARQAAIRGGGEIHFQPFTGELTFTFQVQGGMSVAELMGGKMWQLGIAPLPDDAFTHPSRGRQRQLQRTVFHIAVHPGGEEGPFVLRVPITMHRPIPSDTRIKLAQLKRVKEGGRMRWYAIVTSTRQVPDEPPVPNAVRAAGLDTGWRRRPDGSLRVGMLTLSGGQPRELALPARWMKSMDDVDAEQGRLDEATNACLATLRDYVAGSGAAEFGRGPDDWRARVTQVTSNAKSGGRALGLLRRDWAEQWPEVSPGMLDMLNAWHMQDRRDHRRNANRRARLIRHRKDLYRNWAAEIVSSAGSVVMNQLDLRASARTEFADGSDSALPDLVRKMRVRAALSELRTALTQAANREGVVLEEHATGACPRCSEDPQPADRADLIWACRHCGLVYDQDEGASRVLLAIALKGAATASRAVG